MFFVKPRLNVVWKRERWDTEPGHRQQGRQQGGPRAKQGCARRGTRSRTQIHACAQEAHTDLRRRTQTHTDRHVQAHTDTRSRTQTHASAQAHAGARRAHPSNRAAAVGRKRTMTSSASQNESSAGTPQVPTDICWRRWWIRSLPSPACALTSTPSLRRTVLLPCRPRSQQAWAHSWVQGGGLSLHLASLPVVRRTFLGAVFSVGQLAVTSHSFIWNRIYFNLWLWLPFIYFLNSLFKKFTPRNTHSFWCPVPWGFGLLDKRVESPAAITSNRHSSPFTSKTFALALWWSVPPWIPASGPCTCVLFRECCLLREITLNGSIHCVALLLPLKQNASAIHPCYSTNGQFVLFYCWIVSRAVPQSIHLPVEGHSSSFQFLVIVNKAAINIQVQVSVWTQFMSLLGRP